MEFAAVGTLVVDIVRIATSLLAKWQQSSAEIATFALRARALAWKWEQTKDILRKQGLHHVRYIKPGLEEAVKILTDLQEEQKKLQNSWRWSRNLRQMTLPSTLTILIEEANIVLGGFETSIEYGNRLAAAGSTYQDTQISRLQFREDKKYVPLGNGVTELKSALECQDGGVSQVVTLHGPFGSGKTALGKYLALLCRGDVHVETSISTTSRELQNTVAQLTNSHAPSARVPCESPVLSKDGLAKYWSRLRQHIVRKTASMELSDTTIPDSEGPRHIPFADKVVFLRCGRNANSGDLLHELCRRLGYPELVPRVTDGATSSNISGNEVSFIQTQLTQRLHSEQILIVLDDIWEETLVQDLLLPGAEGVKFLLISHMEWIWLDADRIFLQKPTLQEAHQILANHLKRGLPEIPSNIKNQIIVEHSKHSPWKIARITRLINEQCEDGREDKILEILKSHEHLQGGPTMPIYSRLYSKETLTNACSLVMNGFKNQESTFKLACLVAILGKTRSVPAVIFGRFLSIFQCDMKDFANSLESLKQNRVITIDEDKGTWVICEDFQNAILSKETLGVNLVVSAILEFGTELLKALFILYGKENHWCLNAANRATIQKISSRDFCSQDYSIEPFVYLLLYVLKEVETNDHLNPCTEVIIHYVKHARVTSDSMDRLIDWIPLTVEKLTSQHLFTIGSLLDMQDIDPQSIVNELHSRLKNLVVA